MIEKVYKYSMTTEKTIERLIADENVHLNHMILPEGDQLPEHDSNSNLYMIIVKGTMSIQLAEAPEEVHYIGEIVNVPEGLRMNVINKHPEILEFFVVKAPAPK